MSAEPASDSPAPSDPPATREADGRVDDGIENEAEAILSAARAEAERIKQEALAEARDAAHRREAALAEAVEVHQAISAALAAARFKEGQIEAAIAKASAQLEATKVEFAEVSGVLELKKAELALVVDVEAGVVEPVLVADSQEIRVDAETSDELLVDAENSDVGRLEAGETKRSAQVPAGEGRPLASTAPVLGRDESGSPRIWPWVVGLGAAALLLIGLELRGLDRSAGSAADSSTAQLAAAGRPSPAMAAPPAEKPDEVASVEDAAGQGRDVDGNEAPAPAPEAILGGDSSDSQESEASGEVLAEQVDDATGADSDPDLELEGVADTPTPKKTLPPREREPKAEPKAESNPEKTKAASAEPEPEPEPPSRPTIAELLARAEQASTGEAASLYKRVLDEDKDNIVALEGLVDIAVERERHVEVIRYANRALRIKPNSAALRIKLGDAYLARGETTKARIQFTRAKQLGSSVADARLANLGQ